MNGHHSRRDGYDEYDDHDGHDTHDGREGSDGQRFGLFGPDGPMSNGNSDKGSDQHASEGHVSDLDGDGLGADELALRRLLHGAVQDIQPVEGALDQLRRAVPARRARRRQALVGVAAAALLVGAAVPAFVHAAGASGGEDTRAVNAGHGEQAQGGIGAETSGETGGETDGQESAADSGGSGRNHRAPSQAPGEEQTAGSTDGATGAPVAPPGTASSPSPACQAAQLGVAAAQAAAPDAEGTVYGTFRIANVSDAECTVSTPGAIAFQTAGAADPAKVDVVAHVAGDAATGLPDPAQEPGTLRLKPEDAYEVQFAWVPADTCPKQSEPAPDPTPTGGGSTSGSGTAGSTSGAGGGDTTTSTTTTSASEMSGQTAETADGVEPQLTREDGAPQEGSVTVTHTPEAGAPTAQATVPNACSGTIYHTGVLPAQ
ncbi:hypothetical protein QCN29_03070 [Streptomyces sp. HNM0663]|uniref:DUF4232 domain-containing protein n=1 Tax=Streptomyces chengmaiensis TaxID=3040919 RepID=A0ABT6HGT8_9ACTN|nr:hypothetical protein [Streptomyces chengmaiensis]MDH2387786.1 hypothetical protein [Streptomyces chengmaiensis]